MMPRIVLLAVVVACLPGRAIAQGTEPDVVDCRVVAGQEVDRPVSRLVAAKPIYPDSLRGSGLQASVRLRFVVCPDGMVDSTSLVVQPSIDPRFDRAAGEAAIRSTYRPAQRGGRPVAQIVEVLIRFVPPDTTGATGAT
ncbi:MAG: TonB family protein [Gemmatimonadetes bacterium]|nr:TonB family protein [Gemmatimonadota bacterium]